MSDVFRALPGRALAALRRSLQPIVALSKHPHFLTCTAPAPAPSASTDSTGIASGEAALLRSAVTSAVRHALLVELLLASSGATSPASLQPRADYHALCDPSLSRVLAAVREASAVPHSSPSSSVGAGSAGMLIKLAPRLAKVSYDETAPALLSPLAPSSSISSLSPGSSGSVLAEAAGSTRRLLSAPLAVQAALSEDLARELAQSLLAAAAPGAALSQVLQAASAPAAGVLAAMSAFVSQAIDGWAQRQRSLLVELAGPASPGAVTEVVLSALSNAQRRLWERGHLGDSGFSAAVLTAAGAAAGVPALGPGLTVLSSLAMVLAACEWAAKADPSALSPASPASPGAVALLLRDWPRAVAAEPAAPAAYPGTAWALRVIALDFPRLTLSSTSSSASSSSSSASEPALAADSFAVLRQISASALGVLSARANALRRSLSLLTLQLAGASAPVHASSLLGLAPAVRGFPAARTLSSSFAQVISLASLTLAPAPISGPAGAAAGEIHVPCCAAPVLAPENLPCIAEELDAVAPESAPSIASSHPAAALAARVLELVATQPVLLARSGPVAPAAATAAAAAADGPGPTPLDVPYAAPLPPLQVPADAAPPAGPAEAAEAGLAREDDPLAPSPTFLRVCAGVVYPQFLCRSPRFASLAHAAQALAGAPDHCSSRSESLEPVLASVAARVSSLSLAVLALARSRCLKAAAAPSAAPLAELVRQLLQRRMLRWALDTSSPAIPAHPVAAAVLGGLSVEAPASSSTTSSLVAALLSALGRTARLGSVDDAAAAAVRILLALLLQDAIARDASDQEGGEGSPALASSSLSAVAGSAVLTAFARPGAPRAALARSLLAAVSLLCRAAEDAVGRGVRAAAWSPLVGELLCVLTAPVVRVLGSDGALQIYDGLLAAARRCLATSVGGAAASSGPGTAFREGGLARAAPSMTPESASLASALLQAALAVGLACPFEGLRLRAAADAKHLLHTLPVACITAAITAERDTPGPLTSLSVPAVSPGPAGSSDLPPLALDAVSLSPRLVLLLGRAADLPTWLGPLLLHCNTPAAVARASLAAERVRACPAVSLGVGAASIPGALLVPASFADDASYRTAASDAACVLPRASLLSRLVALAGGYRLRMERARAAQTAALARYPPAARPVLEGLLAAQARARVAADGCGCDPLVPVGARACWVLGHLPSSAGAAAAAMALGFGRGFSPSAPLSWPLITALDLSPEPLRVWRSGDWVLVRLLAALPASPSLRPLASAVFFSLRGTDVRFRSVEQGLAAIAEFLPVSLGQYAGLLPPPPSRAATARPRSLVTSVDAAGAAQAVAVADASALASVQGAGAYFDALATSAAQRGAESRGMGNEAGFEQAMLEFASAAARGMH